MGEIVVVGGCRQLRAVCACLTCSYICLCSPILRLSAAAYCMDVPAARTGIGLCLSHIRPSVPGSFAAIFLCLHTSSQLSASTSFASMYLRLPLLRLSICAYLFYGYLFVPICFQAICNCQCHDCACFSYSYLCLLLLWSSVSASFIAMCLCLPLSP